MLTNDLVNQAQQMAQFQPRNPVEMEQLITAANQLLEQMPDVLLEINERRYAAERAYASKKNSLLVQHAGEGDQVTVARAKAEVEAEDELHAWHATKAEYHYAEDTAQALRTKIFSLLNINKSVTAHFQTYRG